MEREGCIVVEVAAELCVCRELGVDAALLEKVEGDFGLQEGDGTMHGGGKMDRRTRRRR